MMVFDKLSSLLLSYGEEEGSKLLKAASKLVLNLADGLTGGGVQEAAATFDPDKYGQAKALGLTVPQLEGLVNALTADLNVLQNRLNNMSDPSAYMDTAVRDTLSSLGFVNSKSIVNKINANYDKRAGARSQEIRDAHDKYLAENKAVQASIADKEAALAEAKSALSEAEDKKNKSFAAKVFGD